MGKKKKDPEVTEAQKDLLTDEEKEAIETPPEEADEQGREAKPEEEPKPEEKPPEKPEETKPKEKPEEKGEKPTEDLPKELEQGQKVSFIVDGKVVEGTYLPSGRIYFGKDEKWVASKDGEGVIPFAKLDEERQKVSQLQGQIAALEAKVAAASKPEPKKPEATPADLEKLEAEFYDTDNPREFIQKILDLRPTPEPEKEPEPLTPEQIRANAEKQVALNAGMKKVLEAFPVFDTDHKDYMGDDIAYVWTILGTKVLQEKIEQMTKDMPDEAQKEAITQAWIGNVENLLTSAQEAAERTIKITKLGGGAGIDENALREKIRQEESTRVMALVKEKLNLSEKDVRTLGDIRDGSGESAASRVAELDGKTPEELEQAMANMSPEERDRYLEAETT